MPQGLSNVPATFNRCVMNILRSVRELAPSYFDDAFVHSRAMDGKTDVEVHRLHVRKVLTLMRNHKLYANLKRCIFAASKIPLLGCIMGKHGVRTDPEKIKAITDWPVPTYVKGLRKFLGLATYLHQILAQLRRDDCSSLSLIELEKMRNGYRLLISALLRRYRADLDTITSFGDCRSRQTIPQVCDASDFASGCALL